LIWNTLSLEPNRASNHKGCPTGAQWLTEIFQAVPEADAYVMKHIIHDWMMSALH
jgi:hypothetical protein